MIPALSLQTTIVPPYPPKHVKLPAKVNAFLNSPCPDLKPNSVGEKDEISYGGVLNRLRSMPNKTFRPDEKGAIAMRDFYYLPATGGMIFSCNEVPRKVVGTLIQQGLLVAPYYELSPKALKYVPAWAHLQATQPLTTP